MSSVPPDTSPSPVVAAVASVIDGARSNVNPIVPGPFKAYEPDADGNKPRGRPPVDTSHLSQSAEAIRARRRREDAKNHRGQSTGPKFTPADVREPAPLPPGRPVVVVPSPDVIERAVKFFAFLITGAGHVACAIWKNEDMKVPAPDADQTASAIIDGWPELSMMDLDGKKILAAFAVGSLVAERWASHQRRRALPPGPATPSQAQREQPLSPPASPPQREPARNGATLMEPVAM